MNSRRLMEYSQAVGESSPPDGSATLCHRAESPVSGEELPPSSGGNYPDTGGLHDATEAPPSSSDSDPPFHASRSGRSRERLASGPPQSWRQSFRPPERSRHGGVPESDEPPARERSKISSSRSPWRWSSCVRAAPPAIVRAAPSRSSRDDRRRNRSRGALRMASTAAKGTLHLQGQRRDGHRGGGPNFRSLSGASFSCRSPARG